MTHRLRLVALSLSLFCLFSLLIVQFYNIQILEEEKWQKIARRQHFFVVKEPFHRGVFWSNTSIKKGHPFHPQPLVVDIEKFHLFVDPASIAEEHRDPIITKLIEFMHPTPSSRGHLIEQFEKESRSRQLAKWLDRQQKEAIQDWWFPYARRHRIARNALFFLNDYQRSYPFGKLFGQALHTIQGQKDEVTRQALPTGGLELYFNSYVTGKQGERRLKRSPRNAFETGEILTSPEHGADVYLTVNHCLQAIAEEEVKRGVEKCNAKAGWAVMMDPKTGEVLALAHYPFFSPHDYPKYYNQPELIEHTRLKALSDAHEPGSVIKPITLAIGLKANALLEERGEPSLFDPNAKSPSADGRFAGRQPLKDLGRVHQYLNMNMALQKSSNIYVGRVIEKVVKTLGDDWYRRQLVESFGFGQKTGLEVPAESPGLVPTPGKCHPNGKLEWSKPTPISLAMGHNLQANSLQVVRAFAVLANGGILVEPTLIRKIVKMDENGQKEVLLDHTQASRIQGCPRVLDSAIAKRVVAAMKYVTQERGSGRRATVWGYSEAGKTGTAEKIVDGRYAKNCNVATFIGFAPADDPTFVLLVSMDEPECRYNPGVGKNQYGGASAAPVFQKIAKRSLEYLGIPPDDPHGYPKNDSRYDPSLASWETESRELVALYDEWNAIS